MKKSFFLVAFTFVTFFSFSKVTDTDIAVLISENEKNICMHHGDINLIYPGDTIVFNMGNDLVFFVVKKGDYVWNIAKQILTNHEMSKFTEPAPPVLLSEEEIAKKYLVLTPKRESPKEVLSDGWKSFPPFAWVILIVVCLILCFFASRKEKM